MKPEKLNIAAIEVNRTTNSVFRSVTGVLLGRERGKWSESTNEMITPNLLKGVWGGGG